MASTHETKVDRSGDLSLADTIASSGRTARLTLLTMLVLLGSLFVSNVAVFQPRFNRAVNATTTARRTYEAMLNQQVGLRGYVYTGDKRFLDSYQSGKDQLPELNADAAKFLAGEGEVGELYLATRLAQETWIEDWAQDAITVGDDTSKGTPVANTFVEKDKRLFDDYRSKYDLMIAELVVRRDSAIRNEQYALFLTILLSVVVGVSGLTLSVRRNRRVLASTQEPMSQLISRMTQIEHGDFEPRPITSGPTEFQSLSDGLEHAASELARSEKESAEQAAQLADRAARQVEVLAFAREVSGSLSMRYVLRGVCIHAKAVADGSRVVVWLLDDDHQSLNAVGDSDGPDYKSLGLDDIPVGSSPVGSAAKFGRITRGEIERGDQIVSVMAVPMVVGAQVIGVLELSGNGASEIGQDAADVLETMAVHAAIALEAARLHEHTTELAMTDALTGLPNRRRLDLDLATECVGSSRYVRPLAFMMVDVDHFKHYNDTFGHQAGDAALQEIAHLLSSGLRTTDTAYRYGGEEFAFVLRESTIEQAANLAERIRQVIEHNFTKPDALREITISIGVSGLPSHGPGAKDLTAAADTALYQAKQEGRNMVVCAPVVDAG